MRDVKAEVQNLLKDSPEVVSLLGAKHIYADHTKNAKQYPRIVLHEISVPDGDYADDMPLSYEPTIQVSIFHKAETLAIFSAVDAAMKAAGWRRIYGNEVYEEDEMIYHRPCRYKNKFMY